MMLFIIIYSGMEEVDATVNSDDEIDFSKMDMVYTHTHTHTHIHVHVDMYSDLHVHIQSPISTGKLLPLLFVYLKNAHYL